MPRSLSICDHHARTTNGSRHRKRRPWLWHRGSRLHSCQVRSSRRNSAPHHSKHESICLFHELDLMTVYRRSGMVQLRALRLCMRHRDGIKVGGSMRVHPDRGTAILVKLLAKFLHRSSFRGSSIQSHLLNLSILCHRQGGKTWWIRSRRSSHFMSSDRPSHPGIVR